jgi:uncharacterized protein
METLLIILLTLLSTFFGTTTGFGTSTIMVPVLAIWFPLTEVLLFVGIIHWFGDVWKIYLFKKGINLKLILLFGIPGIAASYIGASIPLTVSSEMLRRSLAVFLLAYTLFILFKPKWRLRESDSNALIGGILSGFFAGLFGVGGAVRAAFLEAFKLPKSVYIFTSGVLALFIDSSRLFRYYQGNVALPDFSVTTVVLAVLVSLSGAYLAKKLVDKIPQNNFRYVVGLGLLFATVMLFLNF